MAAVSENAQSANEKKETEARVVQNGDPCGSIVFIVEDIISASNSVIPDGIPVIWEPCSPNTMCGGVPWKVMLAKEEDDNDVDSLYVYLHGMENDSVVWSIQVNCLFTLVNKDVKKNKTLEINEKFDHCSLSWGDALIDWDTLIKAEEGFVGSNGDITVEANFSLSNVMGIRVAPRIDFSNGGDARFDVALIVEGKKIHASKPFLALHSPVFNTMFYGNFDEKEKKEIELKDVEYEKVLSMMHTLYPPGADITDENVDGLLEMADRFDIKALFDRAEFFLMWDSEARDTTQKLRIAGEYRLVMLQGECLKSLTTVDEITEMKDSEDYEHFSDAIKLSLLEKIMKLSA